MLRATTLETVVALSLTIDSNFAWSLTVHEHTAVEVLATDVLHGVPVIVSSVREVCTVISALQESTVCIGNVEQKYMYITLIEHNRGSMKSSSGAVMRIIFIEIIHILIIIHVFFGRWWDCFLPKH